MRVTRSRGLLGLAVAAVAAALILCVAVIALALSRSEDEARAFDLPAQPSSLARTAEAVWVATPATGSLLALDPASGRPLGPALPTGGSPSRLAAGEQSLWAVDSARAALLPVQRDPARVFGAIPVGSDATDAAVAGGAVWVLSSIEGVVRAIQPGVARSASCRWEPERWTSRQAATGSWWQAPPAAAWTGSTWPGGGSPARRCCSAACPPPSP